MEVKNIFVVEDDAFFATAFIKRLEKSGPFKIHHFLSSERAVGQLSALKPEIIFLDHLLGGLSGVDVLPLIKEILPNCEVVIVSGQKDVAVLERALENGASKYFQKDALLLNNADGFLKTFMDRPSENLTFWERFFNSYKIDLNLK